MHELGLKQCTIKTTINLYKALSNAIIWLCWNKLFSSVKVVQAAHLPLLIYQSIPTSEG